MTFDEAWKQIKELSFPIQVPDEADDAEVWLSDLIDVFEELRKEYDPTVEMTKKQYHNFDGWKNHTAGWNMTNYAEWARDEKITATNAMQAWLHPETIKVIEEEN